MGGIVFNWSALKPSTSSVGQWFHGTSDVVYRLVRTRLLCCLQILTIVKASPAFMCMKLPGRAGCKYDRRMNQLQS